MSYVISESEDEVLGERTLIWITVTEYLCHKLTQLYSVCRNHNLALSAFMTYRICSKSAAETTYSSHQELYNGVRCSLYSFLCGLCRSLFVFFQLVSCLSFLELAFLITSLVTLNFCIFQPNMTNIIAIQFTSCFIVNCCFVLYIY